MGLKPGDIPTGWNAVTAGDVGRFRGGNGFPLRFQGKSEGRYPFYKVSDMNNEGNETFMIASHNWISEPIRKALGATFFPANSIVFAKVGAAIFLERKKILTQPSCIDNNMTAFVLDADRADCRYVYYLLLYTKLGALVATTALPSLNGKQLSQIAFHLPPLPEQRAIAGALSDVDALIGALDKLIAKKRDLKRAAMQQLLTGHKRLPGVHGEWEVKRLGDIAEIRDGTHQTPKYVESGVPFFSVENVTSGDFTNTKFISEAEHRFLTKSFKIEKGDILMTRIGSIGDCKLIDWDVEASFYVSLALLKIHMGYSAAFICHYSKSASFKKEVELRSLQSAIPKKINLGPISDVRIEIPTGLTKQTAIAEVLSDMDAELAALEQRRDKTRLLKHGMMQELLTGKTRLPFDEGTPCVA